MSYLWLVLALLPVLGGAERFSCRGRILGAYYADAKSGCKAFHVCVRVAGGGIRDFRFFCPPGTLFHQEAQTCTDWGDDDPLACPADLYDGQFDLFKIGSGFDTKKTTASNGNRDEEPEFGLQRAETGDRRSAQNSQSSNNGPASDLRAAHSSDFFSGQRERGRDEAAPASSSVSPRQSFRRPTTRHTPPATQVTTPSTPPQYSYQPQYETSKRKLVRKRPVYHSTTLDPSSFSPTFPPSSPQPRQYFPEEQKQSFTSPRPSFEDRPKALPPTDIPPQFKEFKDEYVEVPRVTPKQSQKQNFNQNQNLNQNQKFNQNNQNRNYNENNQNQNSIQNNQNRNFNENNQNQNFNQNNQNQNFNQNNQNSNSKYFLAATTASPTPFTQSTTFPRYPKKEGLTELYNYEAQSTSGYNAQGEKKRPFKVRNSFNVVPEGNQGEEFSRLNVNIVSNGARSNPSTPEFNRPRQSGTTPSYRNFNSVSYDSEKENYPQFSGAKQNFVNSPSTTPTTTIYTTKRPEPPLNLNTVAYNTNIGFNVQSLTNYADSNEDDGQYRPPADEDDGQYRPELYERELLSGAHSLNIAASGNRLPDDQKPRNNKPQQQQTLTQPKSQQQQQQPKIQLQSQQRPQQQTQQQPQQQQPQQQQPQHYSQPISSHTAAPRPFRPAPTPSSPPLTTSRVPEPTYTTTFRPQPSTQRTFDYQQTYTTTSRPTESVPQVSQNYKAPARQPTTTAQSLAPVRQTTTAAVQRTSEPRSTPRAPPPPSAAPPRPSTKPPHFAQPASNKEDNSYDYAYYDSDPGFSEYDNIEEFGKTKSKS